MGNSQRNSFLKNVDTYNKSKMYFTNEHKIKLAEWEKNENSIKFVIVDMKIDDMEVNLFPVLINSEYYKHVIHVTFKKVQNIEGEGTRYTFCSVGDEQVVDKEFANIRHKLESLRDLEKILSNAKFLISEKFPKEETLTINE